MQTTDVVACNIESYVNILLVLQQSKIIGKVIEEVFKQNGGKYMTRNFAEWLLTFTDSIKLN